MQLLRKGGVPWFHDLRSAIEISSSVKFRSTANYFKNIADPDGFKNYVRFLT